MLLMETFCLFEQLPHLDFSKALRRLPADNRSNSKIKRLQKVHRAFRQRSQVNDSKTAFFNTEWRSFLHQEAVTYIQNIKRSFRPRLSSEVVKSFGRLCKIQQTKKKNPRSCLRLSSYKLRSTLIHCQQLEENNAVGL